MKIKVVGIFTLFTILSTSCLPATELASFPPTLTFPTPTSIPTIAPTNTSPAPQSTIPSPITFSGEGNAILTVNKWRGPALIHIDYQGKDKFSAWNLSEKQSLLNFALFTDGNYSGTQVLDFSDHLAFQTYFLEVYTTGAWNIEILPFELGRTADVPSVIAGKNNDVVFLEGGKPSLVEVSIDESGRYFVLSGVGDDGFIPIADGTPPYHGVVKIEQDIKMLIIECIGEWQINVEK